MVGVAHVRKLRDRLERHVGSGAFTVDGSLEIVLVEGDQRDVNGNVKIDRKTGEILRYGFYEWESKVKDGRPPAIIVAAEFLATDVHGVVGAL